MAAGGYVLLLTVDKSLSAAAVTVAAAAIAIGTRINPLWPLAAGAVIGMMGFT